MQSDAHEFLVARDCLLACYGNPERARREFAWPRMQRFNWATDYFDAIAARSDRDALVVADDEGIEERVTYQELATRSSRAANWLHDRGVRRGDAILLMLSNVAPLWELMLAAMKIGAVIVPTSTLLQRAELADRLERGRVKAVVTHAELTSAFEGLQGAPLRVALGSAPFGWLSYEEARSASQEFVADGTTLASDPLLLYFTSGTTSKPKLVLHTHASYPVGHLTTMYWLGVQPGDVHLNLSAPGWAKHAYSSFFAPFNAEATVMVYRYERFSAQACLRLLGRHAVTSFCAPPTVWRAMIQQKLEEYPVRLREALSAGEPLNPEVISQVHAAWGIQVRDGYGQTETTVQIGNPPGAPVKPGSMGRPLPGYEIALLDARGRPAEEGEICVRMGTEPPIGIMQGYADDPERTADVMRDGFYHNGDVGRADPQGNFTYVGRTDDVFKSSDYRISPFELESVLLEHPAVAEAAVVPMPDPKRLAVPKAFVLLAAGFEPSAETARSILSFVQERVAPFKRVRCIEFADLPKTTSGKIRRVELRRLELAADSGSRFHVYHESHLASAP